MEVAVSEIISQGMVEEIRRELMNRSTGRWQKLHLELQEDDTSLLVHVELPSGSSEAEIRQVCSLISEVVSPRIPSAGGRFAWAGAVVIDGQVVESALPNVPG